MIEVLGLSSLVGSSIILSSSDSLQVAAERGIRFFIYLCLQVVLVGYILSDISNFANVMTWSLMTFGLFIFTVVYFLIIKKKHFKHILYLEIPHIHCWRSSFFKLGLFSRICISILALSITFIIFMHTIIVFGTTPANWDSMTYHLARMGHYIQQESLKPYPSNFFAQIIYPKASVILQSYLYLMSNYNDNLTQLVQWLGYLFCIMAIYGISRQVNLCRFASVVGAGLFGLLPNVLMESTTTQDDLIMASFAACAIFFIFKLRSEPRLNVLFLATASCSLAIATKFSAAMFMPTIAALVIFYWREVRLALGVNPCQSLARALVLLGFGLAVVMPSGYWDNINRYGHPLGPSEPRLAMSLGEEPLATHATEAAKNFVRLATESISLDGLPDTAVVLTAQDILRMPVRILALTPIHLDRTLARFQPFTYLRRPRAHEDVSSSGIVGLVLFVPAMCIAMLRVRQNPMIGVLAFGSFIAYVLLCWMTPYDPWQWRRLTLVAVLQAPAVSALVHTIWRVNEDTTARHWSWLPRTYVNAVLLIASITGISSILFRENSNIWPPQNNAFYRNGRWLVDDRIAMLTRNRREYYEPIRKFESLVPATATVAIAFPGHEWEYPLFGHRLTRKLMAITPFDARPKPGQRVLIPPQAEFLLFYTGFFDQAPGDIDLGGKWHLRKLLTPDTTP